MAYKGPIPWKGLSNKPYIFEAYDITDEPPDADGNYIFVRLEGATMYAVYIGEGRLPQRVHDETHRACALKKGANQLHWHTNKRQDSRKSEEEDLLGQHPEAYVPTGCNEKTGG